MYQPAPFLITAGALTSIFSFFFGEYFREREAVYRLWLRVFAYGWRPGDEQQTLELCAVMESRERMFRQARAFLLIMLVTLIACFAALQGYSRQYVCPSSPQFSQENVSTYLIFTAITGIILLINCVEVIYIQVAVQVRFHFPFLRFRRRVTALQRLSMIWQALGCPACKELAFRGNHIPPRFYRDLEDPAKAFGDSFIVSDPDFEVRDLFPCDSEPGADKDREEGGGE